MVGLRPVKGREKNASSDNIGYHKSGIIPDGGTLIKCYNIYDSLGKGSEAIAVFFPWNSSQYPWISRR